MSNLSIFEQLQSTDINPPIKSHWDVIMIVTLYLVKVIEWDFLGFVGCCHILALVILHGLIRQFLKRCFN